MEEEEKSNLSESDYKPGEKDEKLIKKWDKRFTRSEKYQRAYRAKWLRFHMLYRAYREKTNYAYETKLMPPIAFEIVETVKPRLAAAKTNIRIFPRSKEDVKSKSIESWDDLVKYYLDTPLKFKDRKIGWINSALQFGDGVLGLIWKGDDPFAWIQDLWLLYPDPEATSLQEDSGWEIVQIFKTKKQLIREEKIRAEKYSEGKKETKKKKKKEGEEEKVEEEFDGRIYKNLQYVTDQKITDPRKERYEINTKKMGQIETGEGEGGETSEEKIEEKKVELRQCWDHEEKRLIVIANKKVLLRNDENPYKNVNSGRIFIRLSDHALLWELWGIGHIEPIETTIIELADSRNQAMDDITFTLDPIIKTRKGAHLTADDLVYEPGAIWELKNADDAIVERPPAISRQWLDKDLMLREEINKALAVSEYAMGMPKGKQEPFEKVNLLLLQTSIRFSLLLRQLEISMSQLVNNLIEMTGEFLTENKSYRIIGKKGADFKEFKKSDKEVKVDAIVEITPKVEKTPEKRIAESLELYKIFVAEDKPAPEDEKAVKQWRIRKRALQKMILEDYGREQYEDLILGPEEEEEEKPVKEVPKEEVPKPPVPPEISPIISPEAPTGIRSRARQLASRIPLLGRIIKR